MHISLEAVCVSLETLSTAVTNAWPDDRTLTEAFGWNCPALSRHDLALLPKGLANRIREAAHEEIGADNLVRINDLPRRLQVVQANILPYLFNANASAASAAYIGTIESLETILAPFLIRKIAPEETWQVIVDNKMMPSNLAKKIRSLNAEIVQIIPDKAALETQIKLIKEATEAAETLPTDLLALKEAREKISNLAIDAEKLTGEINKRSDEANQSITHIDELAVDAAKLVKQCGEAYRITTTAGLAGAFDLRASRLQLSIRLWVVGLLIALIAGTYLGSLRVTVLSSALSEAKPDWGVIWMHIILSLISVGAPLWFAWLATKQIGQNFRLAEDYAFKASVAKAYEGYRKEAVRIDPAFEARLFSSALNRLEEAPLRFVESATHGSPWHELFSPKSKQQTPLTSQSSEPISPP